LEKKRKKIRTLNITKSLVKGSEIKEWKFTAFFRRVIGRSRLQVACSTCSIHTSADLEPSPYGPLFTV
jgi:hypothetical protein